MSEQTRLLMCVTTLMGRQIVVRIVKAVNIAMSIFTIIEW